MRTPFRLGTTMKSNPYKPLAEPRFKNREIVLQGDFSLKKGVNFTEILNDLDSEEQNSGIFALW